MVDDLVVDLARSVVLAHYPQEAELFDSVLAEYAEAPERLVTSLRAPVGMGVDLALMTPYVLAAAGAVAGVVLEKVAEAAVDSARARLVRVWRRLRGGVATSEEVAQAAEDATTVVVVRLKGSGVDAEVAREIAERVTAELLARGKNP